MAERGNKQSLQTLAASLGISAATVSNAYNKPEVVSAKTRQRIYARAAELGYSGPHPAARQLRRGKTDAVGLIFTDEMSFAFRDQASIGFLEGLAGACAGASRNLLLMPAGPPHEGMALGSFASAAVDGIIIYSVPDANPYVQASLDRQMPVVLVDQPRNAPADWVGIDDREAARQLAVHLAGLGHRRVGVITSRLGTSKYNGAASPERWESAQYAVQRERLRGLADGFAAAGVAPGGFVVEERYEATEQAGASALNALLGRDPGLTAVCALADVLAIGALAAAAARGLSVPEDLSITGFDDVPAAAGLGLTTISQSHVDKGRMAGELLLRRIDAGGPAAKPFAKTELGTSLLVRTSTARPPARPAASG